MMESAKHRLFDGSTLLFVVWAAVMGGCIWGFIAVLDKGWVMGLPIAIAFGATQVLAFGK